MTFKKYSDSQLKKYRKILLIIGIAGLVLLCFALGYGVYQMNTYDNTTLIYLIPTVFCPLAVLPSIVSDAISKELKKREEGAK